MNVLFHKESISLTLAILCATVCFSDNIDTITLIFCEGNPDANLLTKIKVIVPILHI